MKECAVVILNYNGSDFLEQFLPTLIKFTTNCELVVADNNSTDHSLQILGKYKDDVSIIKLAENYGYAGGYNHALSQLENEFFILLNSDVEVTKNWTDPLISLIKAKPNIAAAQPKIKDFNNKQLFEYAGAAGGFIDKLGYPYCRGRILDAIETDQNQYDQQIEIFWASGACFIIRASDFNLVGGFDASFFAHMEEIDLCWRLLNRGKKIFIEPASTVYHVGGGTLNKYSPTKTYLNFRNNLLLLYKNLDNVSFLKVVSVRIVLDTLAAIQILFQLGPKHTFAIVRAWKDFFKHNKKRDTNARPLQQTLLPSIIISYYLKGKKTFDKLKFNSTK